MHVDIPEGARVYIFVGNGAVEGVQPPVPFSLHPPAESGSESLWGSGWVKSIVVLVLLAGAFQGGRYLSHPFGSLDGARTAALAQIPRLGGPPAYQLPVSPDGPVAEAEIPSAFLEQLNQPPQVTPPPGAPAPSKPIAVRPAKPVEMPARVPQPNPFGLHE